MPFEKMITIPALPRTEDSKWCAADFEGFRERLRKMQHRRRRKHDFPSGHPKTRIIVSERANSPEPWIEVAIRLYTTSIFIVRVTPQQCLLKVNGYGSSLTTKRMRDVKHIFDHLLGDRVRWDYSNNTTPWMTPEQTVAFQDGCRTGWGYDPKTGEYKRRKAAPYEFLLQGPSWCSQPQIKFRGKKYFFEKISKETLADFLMDELPHNLGVNYITIKASPFGLNSRKLRQIRGLSLWGTSTLTQEPFLNSKGVWCYGKECYNETVNPLEVMLLKKAGVKIRVHELPKFSQEGKPIECYNFFVPRALLQRMHDGKLQAGMSEVVKSYLPTMPNRHWKEEKSVLTLREFHAWETYNKTLLTLKIKVA